MDGDDLQRLKDLFKGHKERTRKMGFDANDFHAIYTKYGMNVTKRKVEDILWEGDENADGIINLQDAISVLVKLRQNPYTCEGQKLANIIEFSMYDPTASGFIDMEHAFIMVQKRFGIRDHHLQPKMRRFIMESAHSMGRKLSFKEFEEQISYRIMLKTS